ncbi:MAG: LysM peptidoglycan-binding domain-containing protein [Gammaproteobacteria bacterium]
MIQNYSNRSLTLLAFLIIGFASGCSRQPVEHAFDINDLPPVISKDRSAKPYNFIDKSDKLLKKTVKQENQSLWSRLVSLYALPEVDNERIDRELDWFLKHPDYLVRVQQRAEPYLHLIVEEIESKNIPGELALLPVVESAFNPKAYSSADASGLWQFIPSTGRLFGLKQNNWYDGRRDIYAATQAATTYLKELSETFEGDWFLALASYNYGKGNVQRSIEKNLAKHLPTDYWSLSLPNETFNYVPKLMAVAKIFANPEQYNIPLQDIPNEPYFEIVNLDSQLDLKKAAELADTSMEEIIKLNPAFNHWCTAPNGPHRLLIPIDQANRFRENLAKLPKEERVSKQTLALAKTGVRRERRSFKHKVQRGESLTFLAKKYGISVAALRSANHLKSNTIQIGYYLKIPGSGQYSPSRSTPAIPSAKNVIYTVRQGDTFWKISRLFSVTSKDLFKWNSLSSNAVLKAGQKLVIKVDTQQLAIADVGDIAVKTEKPVHYTVKQGDSLSLISRKFNVKVSDLRRWNGHAIGEFLIPGQQLKVSQGGNSI